MDTLSNMNKALAYIEEHLTEEIDYSEVSKIAYCSEYHFKRMFSFLSGIGLSEYIRRRRLTLAALDLKDTNLIIIDVAVKYGYNSADSFSRAFHSLHGILPSGNAIGANLDPSHLWLQGIAPVAAIKILGKANAIHHFHAKDTYIDQEHVNMYGLTDMQPYSEVQSRAWTFRSVGYGHLVKVWSDIISALRTYGYDHVISIEHEDPIMSIDEGFMRAVENLKSVLIYDQPADMWWA